MNNDDQDDDLDQIQNKYGIEIIQRYSHPFKIIRFIAYQTT